MKQVERQRKGFKRLGVFGDWDNPYLTMDFKYEADIIRTLGKIIEGGHRGTGPQAGALVYRLWLGSGRGRGGVPGQDLTGH